MKYTFLGFLMLLFGAAGLIIIVMFETITLNNDSEYYVLKEAMEAAMLESIDMNCIRISTAVAKELGNDGLSCDGQIKISEQKFVENFTRRFAANITGDVDDYTLEFYDIMELPPKASVVIRSSNKDFKIVSDSIDISNGLSGILEANWRPLSSEANGSSSCKSEKNTTTDDDSSISGDAGFNIPGTVGGGSVANGYVDMPEDNGEVEGDAGLDLSEVSDSETDENFREG